MGLVITVIAFMILLFLALWAKKSLLISSAITLVFTIVTSFSLSLVTFKDILNAGFHGILTAMEISLLIFGALSFFNYLKAGNFLQNLEKSVLEFSSNKLVIIILLVLFFGGFLEGISGFGTPAMIISPLLLALGYPVYLAAAVPLLANTIPVIFGAVGTPVKIGFADLPVTHLPVYASVLMFLPLLILPLIIKRILFKNNLLESDEFYTKNSWIALSAGVSFALPFIGVSFFGPEFPTIFASLAGLLFWMIFLSKFRLPDTFIESKTILQFFKTFKPYLFVALLLLVGKLTLQNHSFFITWSDIQLQKKVGFFQPGIFFIVAIILLFYFSGQYKSASLKNVFKQTLFTLPAVAGTITILAILARLLSQNLTITDLLQTDSTPPNFVFYAIALLTGMLGSFMTGSATLSNLLFGSQWYQIGQQTQLPIPILMACQLAGAAIGNAISLQNIVMVQAVLNVKNLDPSAIKLIWKTVFFLAFIIFMLAFLLDVVCKNGFLN